jgi:polysaccharide biosynthesis/export protein
LVNPVKFSVYVAIVFLLQGLFSCGSYRQNIMFKPGEKDISAPVQKQAIEAEKNYVIQKNDYLKLEVFSNKGERAVDPNPELSQTTGTQTTTARKEFTFLVDPVGIVKFPMVGEMKLDGLTLRQAEEILQKEYSNYFKEPYVILTYANKRVIVLGAVGGQVIPLNNQNVHLAEVLALAKGLDNNSKAHNIRILRNDTFFVIDFSTIEGFTKGNLLVEPGDIIYVEPIRRPFSEGLRDNAGLYSLIVSLTSLAFIINSIR